MMKRKPVSLLMICLLSMTVQAVNVQELFLNMPASLLPTLPKAARQDLVDFYTNNRVAAMPAAFNNQMVLKNLTNDYLLLQTTPSSTIQLKLLPLNDTATVIAVIHTAQGPLEDSRLLFYGLDWKPLDRFYQPVLKPHSFLKSTDESLIARFDTVCNRLFVRLTFEAGTTTLLAEHALKTDLTEDILQAYDGMIEDAIRLHWTGDGFER
ncbi:MAG: DUF3256 family protein [Bacteroidales bacterium]|nr:DUF3256 family protein [Bacteroidales bacterium]